MINNSKNFFDIKIIKNDIKKREKDDLNAPNVRMCV